MCSEKYTWKILLVLIGIFHSTQAVLLRCYKGTLENTQAIPLDKPHLLYNSSCINHAIPTIIYTFGYRGKVAGPATTAILSAYLAPKKRNVVLLDWEEEAQSGFLGIPLGYVLSAVPQAKIVGNELGDALIQLARYGMNMTQMHLLGHSLGAHVMAYAGRRARENGHVVARITGLDPARAFFEGSFGHAGLDRKCARFVDIIHTDPGGYGTSSPSGTVDFWPNYAGSGGTQPGCPDGEFEMFSPEDLCSHDRSWRYYVEALTSPTAFPATLAADSATWMEHPERSNQTIYMGDLTNTRAQGDFFLTTASKSPYGLGEQGLVPNNNQTRRRRSSTLTRLLKYLR